LAQLLGVDARTVPLRARPIEVSKGNEAQELRAEDKVVADEVMIATPSISVAHKKPIRKLVSTLVHVVSAQQMLNYRQPTQSKLAVAVKPIESVRVGSHQCVSGASIK
jgi:hypothetical protein